MKTILSVLFVALFFLAAAAAQQVDTPISAIQGETQMSPLVGKQVTASGIVTALAARGFYMQTPDAQADKNPKTSEGIYVFTNNEKPADLALGQLVRVTGTVTEYRPRNVGFTLPLTEIARPRVQVLSKDNPLPLPYVLTAADLNAKSPFDQMERFEGMRVKINSLTVTAATGGRVDDKKGIAFPDGVFFGVITGAPRPVREVGIDLIAALPPNITVFDMNPENLRFDGNAQTGARQIHVAAGTVLKEVTGVVDFMRQRYTILLDADNRPVVEGIKPAVPVSAAKEREILVGAFNVENLFDDEKNSDNVDNETMAPKEVFAGRLNKASLAIRNILSAPEVLGIVECENLKVLQKLADRVNADAVAANQPNPNYVAYLEEGNDGRGIDVGYLVQSGKVKVLETQQLGKEVKLAADGAKDGDKLFDRPPFLLRAQVEDAKTGKPFAFTVIVVHLKSYGGISDERDGPRVQYKRRLQAEWLAQFIAERGKAAPSERIIVGGDFNAFQFADGYNDLIGILKGKSDPNVLAPSKAVFETGLKNLVDYIPAEHRYSYVYDGNAQVLDHILVNGPAARHAVKFGYGRLDADFPLIYYNDYNRPERLSDHDAPLLYLSLDEKK